MGNVFPRCLERVGEESKAEARGEVAREKKKQRARERLPHPLMRAVCQSSCPFLPPKQEEGATVMTRIHVALFASLERPRA